MDVMDSKEKIFENLFLSTVDTIYKNAARDEYRRNAEYAKDVAHDCGVIFATASYLHGLSFRLEATYVTLCVRAYRFCPPISKETWLAEISRGYAEMVEVAKNMIREELGEVSKC